MAPHQRPADDGFSIMEVVVATIVLAVAATVLAGLFVRTLGLAQSNTQRTTAANLASQQMEKLRAVDADAIPDGLTTIGPTTVGGTAYTIKQTAEYTTQTGTACSGSGGAITSKRVTLEVTWPNMGNVQAVRSDTLRALSLTSSAGSSTGAVAVAVQNAVGAPTTGVPVTLKTAPGGATIATQSSGTDGCVVFAGQAPGNYSVTVASPGYVGVNGTNAASVSFGISAGTTSKQVLPYDLLGGLLVTPTSLNASYAVPASIGISLNTSVWFTQTAIYPTCVGAAVEGCVSGTSTRLAASLYPAAYGAWAGTCADAKPTTFSYTTVTSGSTAGYTVNNFGYVNATVTTLATGKHLYAVHAADSGSCTAGEVYDLGVVTNGQLVKVALPYGTWRLQLSATGTTAQTAVLSSSTGIVPVSVLL